MRKTARRAYRQVRGTSCTTIVSGVGVDEGPDSQLGNWPCQVFHAICWVDNPLSTAHAHTVAVAAADTSSLYACKCICMIVRHLA